MPEVHFDTMTTMHRMVEAGFKPEQAEALTIAMRDAIANDVATKADIDVLRAENKAEIASLRTELKGDIASLHVDNEKIHGELKSLHTSIKWMMIIGGFIAIAVAQPFLSNLFASAS